MIRKIFIGLFILGLVYILIPGPSSVSDFTPLPDSLQSNEPGDTYQLKNITAYFSDYDRAGITFFYKNNFRGMFLFGKVIPPIELNYPPHYANYTIRDQVYVTFMEEYTYPLKGSIYVGGYEPFVENEMKKRPHNFVGDHIQVISQSERFFKSKTTLRYYPAPWHVSLFTYLGIWISAFALYKLIRRLR